MLPTLKGNSQRVGDLISLDEGVVGPAEDLCEEPPEVEYDLPFAREVSKGELKFHDRPGDIRLGRFERRSRDHEPVGLRRVDDVAERLRVRIVHRQAVVGQR